MNNNEIIDLYNPNIAKLLSGPISIFYQKIKNKDFVDNTVEITNYKDFFDVKYEFMDFLDIRKASRKYIENEKNWYLSLDRSINNHKGIENNKIWQYVASKDENREINSQYGWIVFSKDNGNNKQSQYRYIIDSLKSNPNTRQAQIMYCRPSIWTEWNENGKHDFICTISTWHCIRDNRLYYIVNMRSNSIFTGFINDWAWHWFLYHQMYSELKLFYPNLKFGRIIWNANSLHCYDNEYEIVENIYNRYQELLKINIKHIRKFTTLNFDKHQHFVDVIDSPLWSNDKFFNENFINEIIKIDENSNVSKIISEQKQNI